MFDIVSYQDKGIGMISASPLSMALLTHQGPPVWHPGSDEIKNACRNADKLCQVSFAKSKYKGRYFFAMSGNVLGLLYILICLLRMNFVLLELDMLIKDIIYPL